MNWWVVVRRVQMGVSILGAVQLHSMDGWALSGVGVWAPWHGVLQTVWLHCDEAQQVRCLRGLEGCPLVWGAGIQSQFARRRWWQDQWGGSEHLSIQWLDNIGHLEITSFPSASLWHITITLLLTNFLSRSKLFKSYHWCCLSQYIVDLHRRVCYSASFLSHKYETRHAKFCYFAKFCNLIELVGHSTHWVNQI